MSHHFSPVVPRRAGAFEDPLRRPLQRLEGHRLHQVVAGAVLHGRHRVGHVAKSGQQNDCGLRCEIAHLRAARSNRLRPACGYRSPPADAARGGNAPKLRGAAGGFHPPAVLGKAGCQRRPHCPARHPPPKLGSLCSPAKLFSSGILSPPKEIPDERWCPAPDGWSRAIAPPCCSMMVLHTASPSPGLPGRVVKPGAKIWLSCSAGMPLPVSAQLTRARTRPALRSELRR